MSKKTHPYKQYEGTSEWKILERGLKDLIKNGDVAVQTPPEYIIGYLAQQLIEARTESSAQAGRLKVIELRANEQVIIRNGKVAAAG